MFSSLPLGGSRHQNKAQIDSEFYIYCISGVKTSIKCKSLSLLLFTPRPTIDTITHTPTHASFTALPKTVTVSCHYCRAAFQENKEAHTVFVDVSIHFLVLSQSQLAASKFP